MGNTVITGRGIDFEDLYTVLGHVSTKLAGVTAKLDLDATVTDTDYAALVAVTFPPAASGREPGNGLTPQAIRHQGILLDYLKAARTAFNTLMTKLDADNSVTSYSALALESIVDVETKGLLRRGVYEGTIAYWINNYMTKFNSALTLLDADAAVADTNYSALWAFDKASYIDSTGVFASL